MILNRLQSLQSEFRDMEEEGVVSKEVLEDIDETKEEILEAASRDFSQLEKVGRFKAFFVVKTQISILENMKERVMKSKPGIDNPGVAEDSLSMLDTMQRFGKMGKSDIRSYSFTNLLKLQKEARKLGFFPSSEELRKDFSQDEIESANRFFDNLRNKLRH